MRTSLIRRVVATPTGIPALVLVAFFLFLAIFGPAIAGDAGNTIVPADAYQGPSSAHWLGTDGLGRDVLARTIASTRLSLGLALIATTIASLVGVTVGVLAGLTSGRVRELIGRSIALGLAIPGVLVALVVVAVLGPGSFTAAIAAGAAVAPLLARAAQNVSIAIGAEEYLLAARTIGVRRRALIVRYIMPNVAETVILQVAIAAGLSLVIIASLSFLGIGVQPPHADWGRALNEGLEALYTAPLAAVVPGVAVMLAGLMFTLLGESFARAVNVELAYGRRPRSQDMRSARPALASTAVGTVNHDGSESDQSASANPVGQAETVVDVQGLNIGFNGAGGYVPALADVTFSVGRAEIVGIVGESGSGKSMLARAIAGLLPAQAMSSAEKLTVDGVDVRREARKLGARFAMIFQDPMSSLNPSMKVGPQLTEKSRWHLGQNKEAAERVALTSLDRVGLPGGKSLLKKYPHEFSGGMRQRIMIAMGLTTEPKVLIADEPTTALDVSIQAQILDLLREINERDHTSIVFISHDLAVVSALCSRVVVLYGGRVMEELDATQLTEAAHPYTQALLSTTVDLGTDRAAVLPTITGSPSREDMPAAGCPFAPRCGEVRDVCWTQMPALEAHGDTHRVACWARTPATSALEATGASR